MHAAEVKEWCVVRCHLEYRHLDGHLDGCLAFMTAGLSQGQATAACGCCGETRCKAYTYDHSSVGGPWLL